MKKPAFIVFMVIGSLFFPKHLIGQEIEGDTLRNPMDQLGIVEDKFQEYFFESLKQKAIENYEIALKELSKAEKIAQSPEKKAVIYFEMGKNYTELKVYEAAEEKYNQTLSILGDRLDVLEHLYDLYYRQHDYEKALPLVKRLIAYDEDYKEDLANLYALTKRYDDALKQLDELDATWGETDIRNALRAQIYRDTGNTEGAIENLEQKIENNPKNEKEHLNLIFLYSEQGNSKKAFEAAKNLLKSNPKSELVHLALYKFYLDNGEINNSLQSMKTVFGSEQIELESKYRVLGDFIQYVNKDPQLEDELELMADLFSKENGGKVYEKIGDYFAAKSKKEQALYFYEKGIQSTLENYNLLKNTLLLQLDFHKYKEAVQLSDRGLEIFPAQPLIYLLNGVAHNGMKQPDKAIESLEIGLDFVLDDSQMLYDFYKQLSLAYANKGDATKAEFYGEKASALKSEN